MNFIIVPGMLVLLATHFHDPCYLGESDVPACGPPASFSVHLASSAVYSGGVCVYVVAVEEMMCDVCVDATEGA